MSKEHTLQDSVDEVRRVSEANRKFYKEHGHYSYEECPLTCPGSNDPLITAWYAEWFGERWYDDPGHCMAHKSLQQLVRERKGATS